MCKYNSQRSLKKQRFGRRSAQCDLPILDILGVQDRARIGRKCFENSPEYCFYRLTISRCRIAIRFANRHLGSANRRRSIVASISAHSRAITRGGGGGGGNPVRAACSILQKGRSKNRRRHSVLLHSLVRVGRAQCRRAASRRREAGERTNPPWHPANLGEFQRALAGREDSAVCLGRSRDVHGYRGTSFRHADPVMSMTAKKTRVQVAFKT